MSTRSQLEITKPNPKLNLHIATQTTKHPTLDTVEPKTVMQAIQTRVGVML